LDTNAEQIYHTALTPRTGSGLMDVSVLTPTGGTVQNHRTGTVWLGWIGLGVATSGIAHQTVTDGINGYAEEVK